MTRLRKEPPTITVDLSTGCFNWTGYVEDQGYGVLQLPGRKRVRAHRFYYELAHGPIPAGLVIDHLCHNRRCVNPEHLEAVTQGENIKRAWRANRFDGAVFSAPRPHCSNGHAHTPENTYLYTGGGKTWQVCRECKKLSQRKLRARRRAAQDAAATSVEYAILAAFIGAVVVAVVMVLGQQTAGLFQHTTDSVQRGFDARDAR